MAAEGKREIELEIAHVLFIDIVDYSKLLINQQSEQLRELNEIVSSTNHFARAWKLAHLFDRLLRGAPVLGEPSPLAIDLVALVLGELDQDFAGQL